MGGALASNSSAVAVPASENRGSMMVADLSPTSTRPFLRPPAEIMLPSMCRPNG